MIVLSGMIVYLVTKVSAWVNNNVLHLRSPINTNAMPTPAEEAVEFVPLVFLARMKKLGLHPSVPHAAKKKWRVNLYLKKVGT